MRRDGGAEQRDDGGGPGTDDGGGAVDVVDQVTTEDDGVDNEEEDAGRERPERFARPEGDAPDACIDSACDRDGGAPRQQNDGGAQQRFSQAGIMLQFRLRVDPRLRRGTPQLLRRFP